jgi:hypothetical protein
MRKNCWEFHLCGREPGGAHTRELGVCPAAILPLYDGKNGGMNGGRYCWRVVGTLCRGEIQGTFAKKLQTCLECNFFKLVMEEEGTEAQV